MDSNTQLSWTSNDENIYTMQTVNIDKWNGHISEKVNWGKNITRDKEGHFRVMKILMRKL